MLPGWVAELQGRGSNHKPESEEYGISSFVYRRHRPFHPERLDAMLSQGTFPGVLRSKGFAWVASHHETSVEWGQAGVIMNLSAGYAWKDLELPAVAEVSASKANVWGDRRQELVFIGINMDQDKIQDALDDALVTAHEFTLGPVSWRHWKKLVLKEDHHHHDHEEHEDCTAACESKPTDVKSYRHDFIEDWFPEICDPDILGMPEVAVAKLTDKQLKSALAIRDIPFSSEAERKVLEQMLIPVW